MSELIGEIELPIQNIRRFSIEEYHKMGEMGILQPDERLELIDGVIKKMNPIGSPHAATVSKLTNLLLPPLQGQAIVRVQNPLALDDNTEPEPDIVVVKHRDDAYSDAHPRPDDVLLLIEVADTSLEDDRAVKLQRYAQAGIAEVWLVNLVDECIEVCKEVTSRSDGKKVYRTKTDYYRGDVISIQLPIVLEITVSDILP